MNTLQSLLWNDEKPLRYVMQSTEPLFLAKDICVQLELSNVGMAVKTLDEDEKITLKRADFARMTISEDYSQTKGGADALDLSELDNGRKTQRGGAQAMVFVNEAGLYKLIFKSKSAEAKQFMRWMSHDVLPSLRRQGYYSLADLGKMSGELEKRFQAIKDELYSKINKKLGRALPDKVKELETTVGEMHAVKDKFALEAMFATNRYEALCRRRHIVPESVRVSNLSGGASSYTVLSESGGQEKVEDEYVVLEDALIAGLRSCNRREQVEWLFEIFGVRSDAAKADCLNQCTKDSWSRPGDPPEKRYEAAMSAFLDCDWRLPDSMGDMW